MMSVLILLPIVVLILTVPTLMHHIIVPAQLVTLVIPIHPAQVHNLVMLQIYQWIHFMKGCNNM